MNVKTLENSEYESQLSTVRKYCITKSPGFAGIALLPRYYIVDPKDPIHGKEYGFTDGRAIYLGMNFFKESPKAQAFILIHEVLHVALRHPQRMLSLRNRRRMQGKPWSNEVFNWAVDAIINHSIERILSWVHKPSVGLIEFTNILPPEVLAARPPHRWGAEELFAYLMDSIIMPAIKDGQGQGEGNAGDKPAPKNEQEWGDQNLPKKAQTFKDMVSPMEEGGIKEDTKEERSNWEQRVKRAAAGDRTGGIMKEILFDIPVTRTPWRHILRNFISEAVMPITQVKPSRPSRQNIILSAFHTHNDNASIVPFSPSYAPVPGIRKIVVVVDTSGSIDDRLCEYFCGEIQTLRKKLGCDLTLLTCDTEVHQKMDVAAHENLQQCIRKNGGFKGRGGTDFSPGVAAAEKVQGAAVIVYLTDMQGPYPKRSKLPLLWASTTDVHQHIKPPCGVVTVLKMEEY